MDLKHETYAVFSPDTAFSSDATFERNSSSRLLAFRESIFRLETSNALRNSDLILQVCSAVAS
jgi:hypothetical protein